MVVVKEVVGWVVMGSEEGMAVVVKEVAGMEGEGWEGEGWEGGEMGVVGMGVVGWVVAVEVVAAVVVELVVVVGWEVLVVGVSLVPEAQLAWVAA